MLGLGNDDLHHLAPDVGRVAGEARMSVDYSKSGQYMRA